MQPLPLAPSTPRGWFLPRAGWLAVDDGEEVRLIDVEGAERGRVSGRAALALREAWAGSGEAAPNAAGLWPALESHAPFIAEAVPLEATTLLRRTGWQQLFLELTAACNERCGHCYAGAGPERREALERATAEAALREGAGLGFQVVQLTGGEALLVPWLAELVLLAADLGIPSREVYTNGTLLDAARYAPLRAAGASFAFSLYARDPAVHDRVTELPGSHARTLAAIRRAQDGGSAVRVNIIVTRPEDEAQAVGAAELARELGVSETQIGIDVARPVGRGVFAGHDAPALPWGEGSAPVHGPRRGGGKAAVLPDGAVVPCIFARTPVLGRCGPEGGLSDALLRPAAALRPLDAAGLAAALAGSACALACGECRLGAALLESA